MENGKLRIENVAYAFSYGRNLIFNSPFSILNFFLYLCTRYAN